MTSWWFIGLTVLQFHLLVLCQMGSRSEGGTAPRCPLKNLGLAFQAPYTNAISEKEATSLIIKAPKSSGVMPSFHTQMSPFEARTRLAPLFSAVVDGDLLSSSSNVIDVEDEKAEKKRKRRLASQKPLEVMVIGLSHHNAAVEVREKLAVPEAQWNEVSAQICEKDGIQECAILSTCNRFEVYLGAHNTHEAIRDAVSFLCERSGLSQRELRRSLFMLTAEDAAWHVLRVSGGLDSLVVGEGQILSQVRQCYLHCSEEDGSGGKVVARMLNTALAAGKRVRAETAISRGAVSISSAAVEFCDMKSQDDLGKDFLETKITIIGAGTMSRLLATHMASLGVKKSILLVRSLDKGHAFAEEHPDIEWDVRTMDTLWETVKESDIIYTSTASPDCILTEQNMLENRGKQGRRVMLVDISVPRNVEKECNNLTGVYAYSVDDLKQVVARNTAMRRKQVLEAEDLLREELDGFLGWQSSLDSIPAIAAMQKTAEEMREAEMRRVAAKLGGLSKKEADAVQRLSKGIVNKMLHGPMTQLRAPQGPQEKRATLATVKAMFKLNDL
ncbi:unnamed protein product [Heterosigma akashiwo]|mmetsp:Transcript_14854/g.20495  ORF Transcript_14854/g.20495 Transcript_14854/m.20495 type:complete len:557 (-) Transcript_14854:31-1701(-)